MSFVMFAGCKYFGMMIGDRRSINMDDDIVSNNEEKVIRVNNNVVICAGGATAVIDVLNRTILNNEGREKLTYIDCVQAIMKKSNELSEEYFELAKNEKINANFGIMGLEGNGEIGFTVFGFLKDKIQMKKLIFSEEKEPCIIFLANGLHENLGNLYMERFYLHPEYSLSNLKSIFCEIVNKEKKNDVSINSKFIMEYIENVKNSKCDKISIY